VNRVLGILLLLLFAVFSFAQGSPARDLVAIEADVAKQFDELRQNAGLQPLKVRRDLRVRMEACSVSIKGPDGTVEVPGSKFKHWYMTPDPHGLNDELVRIANENTVNDHVAVGVWFATTEAYPSGMYWVVVNQEWSAAHEAFWGHFYLTDAFEYQSPWNKRWKKWIPRGCRSIN